MPQKRRPDASVDWPLPERPYLPGRSLRPGDDDDVHRIAREAPNPTDPLQWRSNAAWMAGLRLYCAGYFWEAHEVWEPVWMNARPNSRERSLIQGVIQLANSRLKQRMGQPVAARRLAAAAASLFADAAIGQPVVLMGLDPHDVAESAARYLRDLESGRASAPPELDPGT